jgi:hypothetical protein
MTFLVDEGPAIVADSLPLLPGLAGLLDIQMLFLDHSIQLGVMPLSAVTEFVTTLVGWPCRSSSREIIVVLL